MGQTKRSSYAHYYDTSDLGTTPNWVREGVGVEALSLTYNAQKDTYKTILSDNADTQFQNYQIQSAVSGKRIDKTDAIWTWLNKARRKTTFIETKMLEVDMSTGTGSTGSAYEAMQYDILITFNEFLGENATISYDIDVKGMPTPGTVTITGGKPSFTASAD